MPCSGFAANRKITLLPQGLEDALRSACERRRFCLNLSGRKTAPYVLSVYETTERQSSPRQGLLNEPNTLLHDELRTGAVLHPAKGRRSRRYWFERLVANRSYCDFDERIRPFYSRTRDNRQ